MNKYKPHLIKKDGFDFQAASNHHNRDMERNIQELLAKRNYRQRLDDDLRREREKQDLIDSVRRILTAIAIVICAVAIYMTFWS